MVPARFSAAGLMAGAILLISFGLIAAPPPDGLSPQAMSAAGLVLFAIGFWSTGALPEHLTALAFFLFAMLFKVASPAVVFSGFASTALWLVFGGLVIGVAVSRTGLGARLAHALVGRVAGSYAAVIGGIVLVGVILSFLMPSSMGRVVLLMPVVLALADRLGFVEGSRGRTGMALTAGLVSYLPGAGVLPAAVPNMVLIGAVETQYGFSLNYGAYLLIHFPVLGVLKSVLLVVLICALFPDRPRPTSSGLTTEARPVSRDERRLAAILLLSLALWATDFLHGVSPAWIALGAALLCLLPGLGFVPTTAFNEKVNFASLFYVAAVLGMGGVVAASGLGDALGERLMPLLPLEPGSSWTNYWSLVGLSTAMGLVTTVPGVPAVMTPLAEGLAQASGLPLMTVLMTQVIGYSTIVLPYQTPVVVVAMQFGRVRLRDGVLATLSHAVVTIAVLMPIDYLWWKVVGLL